MIRYILRRLVAGVVLLLVVTMVVFAIFFLVPRLAGIDSDGLAARYVGKSPSPEAIAAVKERLNLDEPITVQYGEFVSGLVTGTEYDSGTDIIHCDAPCFGYSFKTNTEVWPQLMDRLPVTGSLAIGAAVIWVLAGVSIGVLSALRRGSLLDRAAMITALAGVSLPIFFTGLVSLALLSYYWPIFPPGGSYTGITENPLAWAHGLVLPWVTLAFLYAAMYARLTRAGMLDTMGEDFIRTARAKGLPERTVVTKHGLRAALTPIITIFGLDFGLMLGGAVLTESTFSLPGLGKFAVDAIRGNDLPVVLGVTLLTAAFVVVCNLIVDVLYAWVDPRVRVGA
ncbi:ABC transporter permease [Streptomonospora salina]|uniref:Peptide/nickel transport system permease protein n=1 Tax=Streptomonospora salina TaxID=104205 RepID=A0A841EDB9_9ACTN|nr:ABC transporter permease [Streptomonospora salina]MBB6001132.1 peptide/nickel transport system permease protein [Streptomonospora salina]